jgi:hypothetical protein
MYTIIFWHGYRNLIFANGVIDVKINRGAVILTWAGCLAGL